MLVERRCQATSFAFFMEPLIQKSVQRYEDAVAAFDRGDFIRSGAPYLESTAHFQLAGGANSLVAASVYIALAGLRQQTDDLDGTQNATCKADSILAFLAGN
jgi:hypothetical protein